MKKKKLSDKSGQLSALAGRGILDFFYENSARKVTVRELASKLRLSRSTIQDNLVQLRKEGFVSKDNLWEDNWQNRLIKTNYFVEKIAKSGLIDHLDQELAASAIILFGSFRKGESTWESDIDIFIECARRKDLNLSAYERKLKHKIQLFMEPKITLLPDHLLNNVVNGIKIKGHFTIK